MKRGVVLLSTAMVVPLVWLVFSVSKEERLPAAVSSPRSEIANPAVDRVAQLENRIIRTLLIHALHASADAALELEQVVRTQPQILEGSAKMLERPLPGPEECWLGHVKRSGHLAELPSRNTRVVGRRKKVVLQNHSYDLFISRLQEGKCPPNSI